MSSERLTELEAVIERGMHSFVDVGTALMEIRDGELYREAGFSGFVEYLESKPWGISRGYAYNVIESAQVSAIAEVAVESQARELAPLLRKASPAVVQQVYAEAVSETNGKPTAAVIREKVLEILPKKKESKTKHSDYNRRIDEGVIPKLKSVNEAKLEAEDWHSYSRTTLRRHIKVMTTAHQQLEEWLAQAEKVLGTMPAK